MAAPAHAGTAWFDGEYAHYDAAPGEVNRLTVSVDPGSFVTFTEKTLTIQAGQGCTRAHNGKVRCPTHAFDAVIVSLGDMDDRLTGDGTGAVWANGGDGDDVLVGSPHSERGYQLFGDAGDDRLDDGAVNGGLPDLDGGGGDFLVGGDGDDLITAHAGGDYLDGGAGADRLYGGDGADDLNGNAHSDPSESEPDVLEGGAGNDTLDGAGGDDVLRGGHGDDRLYGDGCDSLLCTRWDSWQGNDVLDGGPGRDQFDGYRGDDLFLARDGLDEWVSCGDGDDVVEADALDQTWDCEDVRLVPAL